MKISDRPLNVFPTELAKRRAERAAVLEAGVVDTARFYTLKDLMDLCNREARSGRFLIGKLPGQAELRLLLEESVASVQFTPGQPLNGLSTSARAQLLGQLIERFAFLAENETDLSDWLLAHEPNHKLHGLGQLLKAWRSTCSQKEIADRFSVNRALLAWIRTGTIPGALQPGIIFRAVRWFNPFEERLAGALTERLGDTAVQVFSVLPDAHAETAEERFCSTVRSELIRGAEEEWSPWLEDFADAFEIDDSNILTSDIQDRVRFFVSSNPYGEIEDAARRIAEEIESGVAPDQIALILRDLGEGSDIIPNVFQRFGIPHYFRRGTPAAAHPRVKALLALLNFSKNHSRDRLCDLLLMPSASIHWPALDDADRQQLVSDLRKKEPPRLFRLPETVAECFQGLEKPATPSEFSNRVTELIKRHQLPLPEEVLELIRQIGALDLRPLPPDRINSLLEELLDNLTLKDPKNTESGVWIINPMDAAGLRFDSVYLAGLDDRTFPQIPKADSLLNTGERKALRTFLQERQISCPRLALSETGEALIQEEILFLTAISSAKNNLSLSYTRIDSSGKERSPGEFFTRLRGLTELEPDLGESFHTILPPDVCRAEDEARQTQAWISKNVDATPSSRSGQEMKRDEGVASTIKKWLKDNPEFSATALESLARNRYIFFLEKVLRIKPDRTHEDNTDPMDRGTLIHDILEAVYAAIAEQSGFYAIETECNASVPLASDDRDGRPTLWKITQKKTEGTVPLAVFDPTKESELLKLTFSIALEEFTKAEQRTNRHLGHRTVWETEKQKIIQIIENYIRMDLETALLENRYPALFEMKFDKDHLPMSVQIGEEQVQLKGKIDRVDLIFDDDGNLQQLLVIDYKSKSRSDSVETLEKKLALNLDCQLALYTFAAQEMFFGAHNTPDLNEKTAAVYHLQERELKKMTHHFNKKRLLLSKDTAEAFLETLFSNVRKFSEGDLSVNPLIEGYDDYSHICRTESISPKELLNS